MSRLQAYNNANNGMQHGGWEVGQIKWKLGNGALLSDARRRNRINQRPWSNSSARKLLLLICKGYVY